MQPVEFYFLVLPLASLVFVLVVVLVYYARKDSEKKTNRNAVIE
jgi:hypothetical protein